VKVTNIEEMPGADGAPRWVFSFEEKKLTLTERGGTPSCNIGDEYPYDVEVVKPEKGKWYYKRRDTAQETKPTEKAKPTWKPSKNDDDILLSVAFKGAIELETHHIIPEGNLDKAINRVLQATREIHAGLLLLRPKKEDK